MGASPGVPVRGPARRARAGGRTPGASAARGEKFPTLEREAEKFRPRLAAPKPGQHCPRVGAARRCSRWPPGGGGPRRLCGGYILRLRASELGLRKGQEKEV